MFVSKASELRQNIDRSNLGCYTVLNNQANLLLAFGVIQALHKVDRPLSGFSSRFFLASNSL